MVEWFRGRATRQGGLRSQVEVVEAFYFSCFSAALVVNIFSSVADAGWRGGERLLGVTPCAGSSPKGSKVEELEQKLEQKLEFAWLLASCWRICWIAQRVGKSKKLPQPGVKLVEQTEPEGQAELAGHSVEK